MTINVSNIQPGLLVSLKTSIRGNTTYRKTTLETKTDDTGIERERWEMERTVISPVEMEAAKKVRSKVTSLIRSVCSFTSFGLLCPESRSGELETAVKIAREVMADFNRNARFTQVNAYAIAGRVAADDAEAIRAMNAEVRDLLDDMRQGVKSLDAEAIRIAANAARQLGSMLTPAAEAKMADAIALARKAARKIVKAGELAAQTIDEETVKALTDARLAFLDLDDALPIARPEAEGVAIDLVPLSQAENGDMALVDLGLNPSPVLDMGE